MATKKNTALDTVQSLYLMQVELWKFLDGTESDPKKAEKTLREFKALLKEADSRIMGGEDVLESLQLIPQEVSAKLRKTPVKRRSSMKQK